MLHENMFATEHVYSVRLKNILLGKQGHIFMMENGQERKFHNTKELHHLFVEVLKLNGNDKETKSNFK